MKVKSASGEMVEIDGSEIQSMIDEAVSGLKNKNTELLGELKKARKGAEIDPADYERVQSEKHELETQLSDMVKQSKLTNAELEKTKKLFADETSFTSSLLVDNGLHQALLDAGVKPEFNVAVKAMFKGQAQVALDGANRTAMIGDKKLNDFVKAWSATDEGKHFISAPSNSGGGASGGSKGDQGSKQITRSQFDGMNHVARAEFSKSGGAVIDG